MSNPISSLNVYKRVTVIRSENDKLIFEDTSGNTTSLDVNNFRDAIFKAAPVVSKKVKSDIPVPEIKNVETYEKDVPPNYGIKDSYIRYHKTTENEWKERVDYVADQEDEDWLALNRKFGNAAALNGKGAIGSTPELSLSSMEMIIDLLDKSTAFDAIIDLPQAESLILTRMPELLETFPKKKVSEESVTLKQMLLEVYSYWVSKRSKLKRPLLRRFWPTTSTDDTNPHLVFRPREKEKYKLRKKRQDDMEAFQKLSWLRREFDSLRAVLELVHRREELCLSNAHVEIERFKQRIYDACDTSGMRRESNFKPGTLRDLWSIPSHFDEKLGWKRGKRARETKEDFGGGGGGASYLGGAKSTAYALGAAKSPAKPSLGEGAKVIAGRNQGEPAPSFLDPLETRESYVSSWENATPHVTSYEESGNCVPTLRFRKRPRIGRGGRVCFDRLPIVQVKAQALVPTTLLRAGLPLSRAKPETMTQHLLDLLPRPVETNDVTKRLNSLTIEAMYEESSAIEVDQRNVDEIGCDQVYVRVDDWIDTDEQLWGEEKLCLGPI